MPEFLQKADFDPKIKNLFFSSNPSTNLEGSFLSKLDLFSACRKKPKTILSIKIKEGIYVRFFYSDQNKDFFGERYLDWPDFEKLENHLLCAKKEMDFSVKNQRPIKQNLLAQRDILNRLLHKLKMPEFFSDDEVTQLQVVWEGRSFFLPLEILSDSLLIEYLIPDKKGAVLPSGRGFTFVYSPQLKGALTEICHLKELLKERFELECFSDELWKDYQANMSSSRYFHFAGHGRIEEKKGKIILNEETLEEASFCRNTELAVLNSCFSGAYAEGIVSSFLNENAQWVIASPYELKDEFYAAANSFWRDFYHFFCPENPALSFHLARLKNPEEGIFYRIFGKYRNFI
jgi:hypothetical protein